MSSSHFHDETSTVEKPYSVNFWGSKPGENDNCWTGLDYATKEDALVGFADEGLALKYGGVWVELDGPDIHKERRSTLKTKSARELDREWQREMAMHAGMAFGCDGYNDMMGY